MIDKRPDPDTILAMVKEQEERKRKGKLTVFLGYSAGVGKTYAMLETAHSQKLKGADIVIGIVVTHGRKETEALTHGIERVPVQEIEYKGIKVEELDVDSIIARDPDIVIIDELAHTNVAGSRNSKRYQDVLEILNAGIDVYTTLNIQHIESINDTVEKATGVHVTETIPDTVLDNATDIRLIDITPDDLITRFRDGKIYMPHVAGVALDNFFSEVNLIALREMSFRVAADHVDDKMTEYMRFVSKETGFSLKNRYLVCIGDNSEANDKLIRLGKRYADETKAEWNVLHVEQYTRTEDHPLSQAALEGLEFARSLGAETDTAYGTSVPECICDYAVKHGITRIIIGEVRRRSRRFANGVTESLRQMDLDADIISVAITDDSKTEADVAGHDGEEYPEDIDDRIHLSAIWKQIIVGSFVAVGCLLISNLFFSIGEQYWTVSMMISLLITLFCALKMEPVASLYTAILNALAIDFFFIPPYASLTIMYHDHLVSLVVFVFIGVVVSILSHRLRVGYAVERRKYRFVSAQYALSSDLTGADSLMEIIRSMESHLRLDYNVLSSFYMDRNGSLRMFMSSEGVKITSKEIMAARWVFNNGIPAGRYTDTMSSCQMKYFPMKVRDTTLGVVGVILDDRDRSTRLEQEKILQTFTYEASLALERIVKRESIDV